MRIETCGLVFQHQSSRDTDQTNSLLANILSQDTKTPLNDSASPLQNNQSPQSDEALTPLKLQFFLELWRRRRRETKSLTKETNNSLIYTKCVFFLGDHDDEVFELFSIFSWSRLMRADTQVSKSYLEYEEALWIYFNDSVVCPSSNSSSASEQ